MPALSAARGVPGVKDQTPLAGNFAVFLRSAPPRRDRGSVALGLLAAMAIAARARTVHPRDDDACGVDCGRRDGRDQLLLRRTRAPASTSSLFAINAFDGLRRRRLSIQRLRANRRAARPAGDGADGRHRTHRFPVLMWRICHSDRRTGAAARRIARETDRRPVAPPKSVEGDRVISSLYLRRAVSAVDRDSTND